MADYYHDYISKDMADFTLDALMDTIRASQKGRAHHERRGFDNDAVIRMIKLWKKASVLRLGYLEDDWIFYRFKREPAKLAANRKRSDVLWYALSDFQLNVENRDYYHRARQAMLDFVWDYHSKITDVDQNTDFISKVNLMISAGLAGLANEAYFPAESHS
ncbi:MAG TPA: hypothetical protein VJP02_05510 [Candidatus Sulfotelmatobacter sp.]|nr:hypothetical protein [Candidatus Sulfotelmatobacter sp.]